MHIPYLAQDDMVALGITTADMIDAVRDVIAGAAQGRVWAAPKASIKTPGDARYMMAALAAMDAPDLLAVKTVVMNPDNPKQGLAQINGLVTMLDSVTGLPVAILDGNWITAVRTAALSATAARDMARPDASVIGFVGCGVQASSHLAAFAEMFALREIVIFGRGTANQDRLAAEGAALGLNVRRAASGQEVAEQADLLVTTVTHTGGAAPFLDAGGVKSGSFAAIVDLGAPWKRDSFAHLDRVIIDDLVQEETQPMRLCDPAHIHGDLSGLVSGSVTGRSSDQDRVAFLFRGHALGDLALSALVWERYQAR